MIYNWQQQDWPEFKYDLPEIEDALFAFAEISGHVSGILKMMPEEKQIETMLDLMVSEAIKTSEIEGEYLSRPDVVSSIRNNLGLNKTQETVKDKMARGAGELMVIVRKTFDLALTEEALFLWHKLLLGENKRIKVGAWRTGLEPMQVVSGAIGKEKIHFEAPPSKNLPDEMNRFIKWFNETAPGQKNEIKKAPIRSAIAHLYFESIHPFEDGNGRIGRAIAEKALSQTMRRPVLLSLSQTIETDKKSYYQALESAQQSNEITEWMKYFVTTILNAQKQAKDLIELTLKKAKFFDLYRNKLNERQLKVIKRMMEEEPKGFEGGMTAQKYISLTKTSKATATRDLQLLTELKIFINAGGGRNSNYTLNI
jgi:Fic family protein